MRLKEILPRADYLTLLLTDCSIASWPHRRFKQYAVARPVWKVSWLRQSSKKGDSGVLGCDTTTRHALPVLPSYVDSLVCESCEQRFGAYSLGTENGDLEVLHADGATCLKCCRVLHLVSAAPTSCILHFLDTFKS